MRIGSGLTAVVAFMAVCGAAAAQGAQVGEIAVDRPWYVCPANGKQPERFYPARAQRLNLDGGTVRAQCRVDNGTGKPTSCVWISETVPDYGFGEAGQQLACILKFSKGLGAAPGETVLSFPLRFKLPN